MTPATIVKPVSKPVTKIQITPHPAWAQKFWDDLIPLKDEIAGHIFFKDMIDGTLKPECWKRMFVDMYPLIENFPKYMGLSLGKLGLGAAPGHLEARFWLLQNMKVEAKHADWWCDWAESLNITRPELYHAEPNPQMDAINHYLWYINTHGSFVEGIAATNLAIEWPTGEWSIEVTKTFDRYADSKFVVNDRTTAWLRAHATYDDVHPYEAMELIKLCAKNDEERELAFKAAKRGMEYYLMALDGLYYGRRRNDQ